MKKTLVALAALSAVSVFAQSSVTVFGTVDPSVRSQTINMVGGLSSSQTFLGNNGQGTTQVSFRGVEDLGGGLKATFLVENDINVTDGRGVGVTAAGVATNVSALGSGGGELYAGIEGGFGRLLLGTPNTPSLIVQAGRNPYGTKIGSGFGGVMGSAHVREVGSIVYWTPNFSGFYAGLSYTPEVNAFETANPSLIAGTLGTAGPLPTAKSKIDLGLFYANGPLGAGLSFYQQEGAQKQVNLNATYAFGPAKVFLGFHTQNNDTNPLAVDNTGWNIALNYSVTPTLDLSVNYGSLDDKLAANFDRKIAALGVKYSLSKRTSVYGKYVSETNDNVVAAGGVTDIRTFLVGVQHNF